MPLFEFQCDSCKDIFEELIFSDETPTCPQCHSEKTAKILSRPCRNKGSANGAGGAGGNDNGNSTAASSGCGGCSGGSCSTCGS